MIRRAGDVPSVPQPPHSSPTKKTEKAAHADTMRHTASAVKTMDLHLGSGRHTVQRESPPYSSLTKRVGKAFDRTL